MLSRTLSPNRTNRASSGGAGASGHAGPFDLDAFIASLAPAFRPVDVPPEQWQGALMHRELTPQEQAAREWYFEQRIAQALARFRASRRRCRDPAGRR
jgi:hypothetical protein